MKLYSKHPDAKLDYTVNWADFLGETDTIESSTWDVPDGLTGSAAAFTDSAAVIWLEGGELGEEYVVSNSIVTAEGREDVRSFTVKIEIT